VHVRPTASSPLVSVSFDDRHKALDDATSEGQLILIGAMDCFLAAVASHRHYSVNGVDGDGLPS